MMPETRLRGRPPSSTEGADEAVKKIKLLKKRLKMTDLALAKLIGVNQTTVTRALGRKIPAWTPSMQELWDYAVNKLPLVEESDGGISSTKAEDTLRQAVLDAWDGTSEGLSSLVRVLATLRDYRPPKEMIATERVK